VEVGFDKSKQLEKRRAVSLTDARNHPRGSFQAPKSGELTFVAGSRETYRETVH